MSDPLEVIQKLITCPFCTKKFTGLVKLIPDCGQSVCGECYQDLRENAMDESREFKCQACGDYHTLPNSDFPDNKSLLGLLHLPTEKPLTPQAKKLQLVIESVQEELAKLKAFDAKEFINQHCDELEVQVADAAESAVKHVKEIERGLLTQINEYRQRHLNGSTTGPSGSSAEEHQLQTAIDKTQKELDALAQEIGSFSINWKEYFSRLNVLKSDAEVDAAIAQADAYRESLNELDQKLSMVALNGTSMLFNAHVLFHAKKDHLGELVEMGTTISREMKEIAIQQTPSNTISGHSESIYQVISLPDGRFSSCSGDNTIKVWDAATGQELFTLRGHTSLVYTIAVLPNGWLASGSGDNTIKLWDLEERRAVRTLNGHSNAIIDLKVLKNGNLVSCSHDDSIKVWNPYLSENNLLLTLQGHGNKSGFIVPMGLLSNQQLVTCSRDRGDKEESTLRVWDPSDGKLVTSLLTGLKAVWAVLSLSNDQVVIGTLGGTIKIIDLEDDQKSRVKENAHGAVTSLLQLQNINLVSAGRDKDSSGHIHTIKVWNFADLSVLQQIKTGHSSWILSLSISQDETLLASGSNDRTIKLWPITKS